MAYGGTKIDSLPENTTITEDFQLLSIGEDGKTYLIGVGEMLSDVGATGVSEDADNALTVGSDGKPYLDTAALGDGAGLVTEVNGQTGVVTITAAGLGAVEASTYNAHTILQATSDNTPAALTVGEQTVVGRITGGNITALTAAQLRALANVEDGATGDQTAAEIITLLEAEEDLSVVALNDLDGATAGALVQTGIIADVGLSDGEYLGPVSSGAFTVGTSSPLSLATLAEFYAGANENLIPSVAVVRHAYLATSLAYAATVTMTLSDDRVADGDGSTASGLNRTIACTGNCAVGFASIDSDLVLHSGNIYMVNSDGGAKTFSVATANGVTVVGASDFSVGTDAGDAILVKYTILSATKVNIDSITDVDA